MRASRRLLVLCKPLRREPAGAICVPVFKPLLLQVKRLQRPPIAASGKCGRTVNPRRKWRKLCNASAICYHPAQVAIIIHYTFTVHSFVSGIITSDTTELGPCRAAN